MPVETTPPTEDVSDSAAAPEDDTLRSTRYGTRSQDTPASLSGRATGSQPVGTRSTASGPARRDRPRKVPTYSTPLLFNSDSDLESEDEATGPVVADDKTGDLADHSSDSTYNSDEANLTLQRRSRGRPQGHPRGRPRKDSLLPAKKASKAMDSDSDSEYEPNEPVPAQPAVDTSSKESSSSEEDAPSPRTAPVNLEKRDVYVEILVDGQGSENGGESEHDGDTGRADVSANTPLDVATHTNTDSAGATADSNPLLV
ncbi:hypothetical protein GGF42_007264, partial [Coemansia sp. RSA 2424]